MSEITEERKAAAAPTALFDALLKNPETLSKIEDIISKHTNKDTSDIDPEAPILGNISEDPEQIGSEREEISPAFSNIGMGELASVLPKLIEAFSDAPSPFGNKNKEQTALLLAIKPYLSKNKKGLIDAFLQMSRIGDLLKKLS